MKFANNGFLAFRTATQNNFIRCKRFDQCGLSKTKIRTRAVATNVSGLSVTLFVATAQYLTAGRFNYTPALWHSECSAGKERLTFIHHPSLFNCREKGSWIGQMAWGFANNLEVVNHNVENRPATV